MRLTFNPSVPSSLKKEVSKLVKPWVGLVDDKLDDLQVEFNIGDSDGKDAVAAILTQREYKFATLHIFPRFLTIPQEDKENTIVHELMHVLVAPMRDASFKLLEYYVADVNTKNCLAEILVEHEERVVTEMAKALIDFKAVGA